MNKNSQGKLYGVGVGPGDPELLTIKAMRLIESAGIIVYPAPDDGESFARSIVSQFLKPELLEIPIIIPMRVARFPAKSIYDTASLQIAEHLRQGKDVVVLCEGDPFFYGSFMYLFERLSGEFLVEIVPGISSLMASAAALQRPLAARNDVLSVIPAPLDDEAIKAQLALCNSAAIIKVGRHLGRICKLIESLGLTENAGYLERVSLDNQQVMALSDIDAHAAPYFSMILIYKGAENWISSTQVPMQVLS